LRVYRLQISRFRGFREATITPMGHVFLVGEPRAGRSTIVEALRRTLTPDATRFPLLEDLDFYRRDTSSPIEIEVTLGGLGDALEQEFFDQLEPWDKEAGAVQTESPDPTALDDEDTELVVRLCYRASWDNDEERADHWVDFPKSSDPTAESYVRVPRRLLGLLPAVFVDGSSRPLGFGARSDFRRLVEGADGDDFASALDDMIGKVEAAADAFTDTDQVSRALSQVTGPLEAVLAGGRSLDDRVRFIPEGGSLAGLLRSLGPSLRLSRTLWLPLDRHGSTVTEMLRSAEALARGSAEEAVAIVDDFGEGVDGATAVHLAATYRSAFDQVWLSTRRGSTGEVFRPDEMVRLVRARRGSPRVHQGSIPTTRADRVAARHLTVQLQPALAAQTLVVLEGPHDRAGLAAVALRRLAVAAVALPSAAGISLVDAGAVDRSGGAAAAVKLGRYAHELGFRVVVVLDGDGAGDDAEDDATAASDAVIRLPTGAAIERALVDDVDPDDVIKALRRLQRAFGATLPGDVANLSGDELRQVAVRAIKSRGGLHAQFVELLPRRVIPPVAARVLDAIAEAGRGRLMGVVAL
jgi:putative ATP-dependent endonuclease of OLD family